MLKDIIVPLGVTAAPKFAYFVPSLRKIVILSPREHNKQQLVAYATTHEWGKALKGVKASSGEMLVVQTDKDGQRKKIFKLKWDLLSEDLMSKCRKLGEYDPSHARGRGLWQRSDGSLVFNTGDRLYLFGTEGSRQEQSLINIKVTKADPHRYIASTPHARPPANKATSAARCRKLEEALKLFTFEDHEFGARLTMGWIACTMVLTLIDFRPQIAIHGERGSGKSRLITFLAQLLGEPKNCLHLEADASTEPGIRQTLAHDALPVLLDEFEAGSRSAAAIIGLFRIMSNPKSGAILKGSPEQVAHRQQVNTMALIGGINIRFTNPADATRFVKLSFKKKVHDEAARDGLVTRLKPFNAAFGTKIARRMIDGLPRFRDNLSLFCNAILDRGGDNRAADLHGHLLAGYWTLVSDQIVSAGQARELTAYFDPNREDDQEGLDVLNHLLGFNAFNTLNETIGDLLAAIKNAPNQRDTKRDELAQFGIAYEADGDFILIANKHPGIERVFKDSRWAGGGHHHALRTINGATNFANKTKSLARIKSKVTALPGHLLDDESDETQAKTAAE